MDYEKLYKEALERAREELGSGCFDRGTVEYIFPELKESEDEGIRKEIINCVKNYGPATANPKLYKDMISWLEKQGEKLPVGFYYVNSKGEKFYSDTFKYGDVILHVEKQDEQKEIDYNEELEKCKTNPLYFFDKYVKVKFKEQNPVDKFEPKFRNGQWIVWQDRCYKVNYNGCGYELVDQNGLKTSSGYEDIDENAHIWNIAKDAKDGDVLSFDNECSNYHSIGIFKRIASENEPNGNTYRCYVRHGGFKEELEIPVNCGELHHCGTSAHPATKEQRDFLFQKMHEAGYEWNAEKKIIEKRLMIRI